MTAEASTAIVDVRTTLFPFVPPSKVRKTKPVPLVVAVTFTPSVLTALIASLILRAVSDSEAPISKSVPATNSTKAPPKEVPFKETLSPAEREAFVLTLNHPEASVAGFTKANQNSRNTKSVLLMSGAFPVGVEGLPKSM